ncbi:tyrosine-type recombinase/integrase [Niastella populi]|uniref:Integrase n=1 Tax=Niastella populi TaxID=550983 RepID=A0A1V9GB21_9BACT|nr:site-specific integrase [Niastella populi]OQP67865.1 hypothetical protein A4R26_10185 [Niastella populi]
MKKDLQQLFNEFMYECEYVRKVRPETLRGYKQTFDTFYKLMPSIGIESITPSSMIQFFKILQERKRVVGRGLIKVGIKKSTAATYWSKLNSFFEWLKVRKYIKNNPFEVMEYPVPEYVDKKFLKKEEIEKILAAVHNQGNKNILLLKRNLSIFYILLFCGLRREELILLQVRDIDFERRIVTVRGETSKSGRSRQLPLHSIVAMHLKDYLHERRHYVTPYLIVSAVRDDKLSYDGLLHFVNRIKKTSGVEFHLHRFRHTFAVNFLQTSNNIAMLKQLMGHNDIRMTMVYLRCLPTDEMRGDIEQMSVDRLI